MTRQFTIPVIGAAVFHAALFWGFGGPASIVPITKPSDRTEPLVVPFEIPSVTDIAVSAETPVPRGEPQPSLPEPMRPAGPTDITITIPPPGPPVRFAPDRIAAGPVGVPEGAVDGIANPGVIWNADSLDNGPMVRAQVAPVYPAEARRNGIDGTVVVGFTVDEAGRVMNPYVISRTDPLFEEAALRAVGHWRFAPGRHHGRVVRFKMAVPIVFRMNEATS